MLRRSLEIAKGGINGFSEIGTPFESYRVQSET